MRVYLTVALLFMSLLSHAAEQTSVHISATAEDLIGKQLVYHLREAIRVSNGIKLVDDIDDSFVRLNIVTIDPDSSHSGGYKTVYSAVWTVRQFDRNTNIYITNYVGICGANRTGSCAITLVSQTDEIANDVRRIFKEFIANRNEK